MDNAKECKALLLSFSLLVASAAQAEMVEYRDFDANAGAFTNAVRECTIVTAETGDFEDGDWYAVTGSVERTSIQVNGAANLILCDGASLRVEGWSGQAGINVSCNGSVTNSLAIYGQTANTGWMEAKGGDFAAGIGGGKGQTLGALTVHGGILSAMGGRDSAGIGGGESGSGGTVTINGGRVYAFGDYAAGIGGGQNGSGGAVTINGGMVEAGAGWAAVDIGRGNGSGSNGTLVINGGNVRGRTGAFEQVVDGRGERLFPVTVNCDAMGNADVALTLDGLEDYGSRDLYPFSGNYDTRSAFLWLPNGTHYFTLSDGTHICDYRAVVNGSATTVDSWAVWVRLPTGMASYRYVVSNLTDNVEIQPTEDDAYALPLGAKVGIYAVADKGYAIAGANPHVIDEVAGGMAIDASQLPKVLPVTIGRVATNDPWNDAKGGITIHYTLAELDADALYKVAFDITADGRTAGVTNETAKLSNGQQPLRTIDTVKLFGRKVTDKEATVKVSLIAMIPPDGQLWKDGPIWAECNLGADRPEDAGWYFWWGDTVGYTNNGSAWVSVADGSSTIRFSDSEGTSPVLSTYLKTRDELAAEGWIDASGALVAAHDAATVKLGAPWRMMTAAELEKLVDPNVCRSEWTEDYNGTGVSGYLVTGVAADYADKSIFLPAAGWGLGDACYGTFGYYMSSSLPSDDADSHCQYACDLCFSSTREPALYNYYRYAGLAVRPVKDAETLKESLVAFAQEEFWLGPGGESCPWTVTVGAHPHMTAVWTSGDGSVTNVIDGTFFRVSEEVGDVTVIFTAEPGREIVGDAVVNIGTVDRNISFGEGLYKVPRAVLTETIAYLDRDAETGTFTNAVRRCVLVETSTLVLESGWYAVTGGVEIPAGTNLTVAGDVHLVLCDGALLTVAEPGDHAAGIAVVDANRLTVYGQEAGTGVLVAQGGKYSAGIGGYADGVHSEPDCGTVAINGGTVVATGGDGAAGIGCSPLGRGGHVAIHGGTVTATSGIGGTGIGCCVNPLDPPKEGSEVVVTGGKVTATGLRYDHHQKDIYFADISISGGVFARRPDDGWCAEHFTVFANPDSATSGDYPYVVLPSRTVVVGAHPHMTAAWTGGDGTETNAFDGASFAVPYGSENVRVVFTVEPGWEIVGDAVVDLGTVTDDIAFGKGNDYRVPEVRYLLGDLPYLDWDGTQMINAALPKYLFTIVTDETREMSSGWYAVTNDVVLPNGGNIKVTGDVRLVLCDTASLTITNATGRSGGAIDVPETASLTIYGQEAGTGALRVHGVSQGAGIGGGNGVAGGMVTINGGTVTAQGGVFGGAGIGGGNGGAGGMVTIRGGTVTAQGGAGGAGIGGGIGGDKGGTVTIYDGAVSASGGANTEGIGPGLGYIEDASKAFTVTIFGGIFRAKPRDTWLVKDRAAIANQDVTTAGGYPWAVVPYPAGWPVADDAVKARFAQWRNGVGSEARLDTDAAQKAFLLNVAARGVKELKIESIDVDAEGYSTIVVSAPGTSFFDRIDLGSVNGVLYVQAGDALETMVPKAVTCWTMQMGKANIRVRAGFVRAAIGFKTPEEVADTVLPERKDPK